MQTRAAWALGLVLLVGAGCNALGVFVGSSEPAAPTYPGGCAEKGLGKERCDRIVAWGREQLRIADRQVVRIDFPTRTAAGLPTVARSCAHAAA